VNKGLADGSSPVARYQLPVSSLPVIEDLQIQLQTTIPALKNLRPAGV